MWTLRRENFSGDLPSRVSFSRARFFLCSLLPSACYAGYWSLVPRLIRRLMNKTAHWVPAIPREISEETSYWTVRLAPKNSSSPQYSNLTSDLPVIIESVYLSVNKPFQRARVNGIDRRVACVFKRRDTSVDLTWIHGLLAPLIQVLHNTLHRLQETWNSWTNSTAISWKCRKDNFKCELLVSPGSTLVLCEICL